MAATKKTAAAARKTIKTTEAVVDGAANDAFAAATNITNAARDQFDTLVAAFTDHAETVRGQTEDMMETVRGNFEAAQTRFQSVNAELVNAAREEITDAVDFANELARAKTVADALEIQRGYWTKLFETRVERARDLTNTAVEAARETFEPYSKSMTSAFSNTAAFEKFFPFAAK